MKVTTVLGSGTAEAAPERVQIGIVIRGEADTTKKAKEIAKTKMGELYEVIRRLEGDGVPIGEAGLATNFSITQRYQHPNPANVKPTYEARFNATVTSGATGSAAQIFDLLTTIEGAVVESPTFAISETLRQKLRDQAFRAAVKAAKGRFQFQCEVIGVDPSALEIVNWEYDGPSYGSSSGKLLRVGSDEVTVTGASVQVKCDVRLTYDRKLPPSP
jgi:uncharacterized protein YggE